MTNPLDLFGYLRVPIAATSAVAASLSGLLYWKQKFGSHHIANDSELIYPRTVPADARTTVLTPADFSYFALDHWETVTIPTPDKEQLHAYLIHPSNAAQRVPVVVLTFHGNAGNIGHRIPITGVLDKHLGVTTLMVEYRGYGKSTGSPDEKGLNIDATAAIDYIRSRDDLKGFGIVVYGQSLGGAVSIQLVAREQAKGDIRGLVLENTFLSIRKLIPSIVPAVRFIAPLCHQIWPSDETIPKIKVPTLFLSGAKDEIVPPSHMTQLHSLSTAPVKKLELFANGTHNDSVASPGYFEAFADFLGKYCLKGTGKL